MHTVIEALTQRPDLSMSHSLHLTHHSVLRSLTPTPDPPSTVCSHWTFTHLTQALGEAIHYIQLNSFLKVLELIQLP